MRHERHKPPDGVDWRTKERYDLAREIVCLVEEIQRDLYGTTFFGGVNWNAAIVNGQTDSLENLILRDATGYPVMKSSLGTPEGLKKYEEVMSKARERIKALFERHRNLIAELELSGMKYGNH